MQTNIAVHKIATLECLSVCSLHLHLHLHKAAQSCLPAQRLS